MSREHPHNRFDEAAHTYDQTRPGYPTEAIDWLVDETGVGGTDRVLDFAAGTGLLTRALLAAGVNVEALEPNESMRNQLLRRSSLVPTHAASAERTGLDADAFALATVGQGYHWLSPSRALPEIHRILRPGGHFAVIWLRADRSNPLQDKLEGLASRLMSETERPGSLPDEPLDWEEHFEPGPSRRFRFHWRLPAANLEDYVRSFSVVVVLPPADRGREMVEVSKWAEPGSNLELPFHAEVHLARARVSVGGAEGM